VYPWVQRLRRAKNNAEVLASIKAQIADLPAATRWAAVVLGYAEVGAYSAEEASAVLLALPEDTRARPSPRFAVDPTLVPRAWP